MAQVFEWISQQAKSASATFSSGKRRRELDSEGIMVLAFAVLCAVVPLEIGQLSFAFVGAVTYGAVQAMRNSTKAKFQGKSVGPRKKLAECDASSRPTPRALNAERPERSRLTAAERHAKKAMGKEEYRQPSAQPVAAPTFSCDGFVSQVEELVEQITPTAEGDRLMKELAAKAQALLKNFIPEAEVVAFASADFTRGTAFGVAIPEVDIILNATPAVLAQRLQSRTARPIPHAAKLDARKLQKSALRACTDELVAGGVFKFRRSAFKGLEPKVTLLATGFHSRAIPVDFSINTVTPLYNAALLTECGQIDPRAKELILLVRRWAKDRGVSHAAKGHLSPYSWSLMAIYFMQVWEDQGGPPLPALDAFKGAAGLMEAQAKQSRGGRRPGDRSKTSVATFFKEFVHFYTSTFQWRNEAISVRVGVRKPPSAKLPLHIVDLADGSTHLAPCIEDPFEPTRNLSNLMTTVSYGRLKEELARAAQLCSRDASLSEFLEPWVPPERGTSAEKLGGDESAPEA